jgi:hypothetical protein
MASIVLIPAYGRSYPDERTMLKDWREGKDFRIHGGPYCSVRDLDHMKRVYWAEDIVLWDKTRSLEVVVARGLGA